MSSLESSTAAVFLRPLCGAIDPNGNSPIAGLGSGTGRGSFDVKVPVEDCDETGRLVLV